MADAKKKKRLRKKRDRDNSDGGDLKKGKLGDFLKGRLREGPEPGEPTGGLKNFLKGGLRKKPEPGEPTGGLKDFIKGRLRPKPDPDEPTGGLKDFLTGKLRKKPGPDERTGGLKDFLSGKFFADLVDRNVLRDEIDELDNHIKEAEKLEPQYNKEFLKDAYAMREKLKDLEANPDKLNVNDLAAQRKLQNEIDDFKINHTRMRELITGEKDEIEEVRGFFDFIRDKLSKKPKPDEIDGGLWNFKKGKIKDFRNNLRKWPRGDIDKEIENMTEQIRQAVLFKGEYVSKFLENVYALREKLKKTKVFESENPSEDDLDKRAEIFEDLLGFKEEFKEVLDILPRLKEQAKKQQEKKAFRKKKLEQLEKQQEETKDTEDADNADKTDVFDDTFDRDDSYDSDNNDHTENSDGKNVFDDAFDRDDSYDSDNSSENDNSNDSHIFDDTFESDDSGDFDDKGSK